ncbi:MAG: plasmid pRiA4b ORF-3 family protein [Gammaproteobacteria bacterium]|nr:plasmid pRiA4b ORF-3 family protein [Gammaproteobacteria bacterium]
MIEKSNVVHLRQNYQIKVNLNDAKPPIWRRLVVDSRITLEALHDCLQIAMGWTDSHLHQFVDSNKTMYAPKNNNVVLDFGRDESIDESQVLLNEILKKEKDWLSYDYDFGNDWSHKIVLEKLLPHTKDQLPVVCIKGKRACPPENCGGIWAYKDLLEQLAASVNERNEALLEESLGKNFDTEYFNPDEVNIVLKRFFEGAVFNGKAGLANELQRIKQGSSFSDRKRSDLSRITDELLNDPNVPEDMKELIDGIREATNIILEMDKMLDISLYALENIIDMSNDKKVIAIAEQALEELNSEDESPYL